MKLLSILLLTAISITACNLDKKDAGSISGSLKNIKDGTVLSIIDLNKNVVLQKVAVKNGKFKIDFNLPEPGLFGIWGENPKYDKDRLFIWLENSKILLEGNFEYIINSKVTGSKSHQVYMKLDSINKRFEGQYNNIRLLRSRTTDINKLDSISRAISQVLDSYRDAKINFYSSEIESDVALYYLCRQMTSFDIGWYGISVLTKEDIEILYNKLPEDLKNSNTGELIKEYISLPEIPAEGERFIDFTQQTPDGKTQSISAYLGKFTILEFWASDCGPCRGEHPAIRKLYIKYHKKGLNIISISADTDKDEWINAIKADSLPWLNVSDLKGFNNKAFMIYGVRSIPQMILLDENGIILDNKLARKSPEQEIEKRFKQNGL